MIVEESQRKGSVAGPCGPLAMKRLNCLNKNRDASVVSVHCMVIRDAPGYKNSNGNFVIHLAFPIPGHPPCQSIDRMPFRRAERRQDKGIRTSNERSPGWKQMVPRKSGRPAEGRYLPRKTESAKHQSSVIDHRSVISVNSQPPTHS